MGQDILITGAASGIGAATARLLAAHDDTKLTLVDQSDEGLEALSRHLQMADWWTITMDISDPEAGSQPDLKTAAFTGGLWARASLKLKA